MESWRGEKNFGRRKMKWTRWEINQSEGDIEETERGGFTSGGMSFLLISCNRTSGIRRARCSRQSQQGLHALPHPHELIVCHR